MSSSLESDLDIGITQEIALQKTKSKSTKKKATKPGTVITTDDGKNEGDDPHWAYEPPEGASLLDHSVNSGAFEWDAVKDDDDTELWLIRIPDSIKSKHLKGLEIDPPSSRTARIGGLTRKNVSYDVWSIGDDDAEIAGAEELRGLSCLLPCKRKGKLYIAPKLVSRHIVVSAQPAIAIPPEHEPIIHQNPPRPSYPKDVLKHRFVPYGAWSQRIQPEDLSMDVDDVIETTADRPTKTGIDKPAKTSDSKGKKRKVDGDTPKKSKKHKPNA